MRKTPKNMFISMYMLSLVYTCSIIADQHVLGSFFWGWDNSEDFNVNGL